MTPQELHAALLKQVAILQAQRRADPYGFAFGPRRPFDGYRPSPFGAPAGPPPAHTLGYPPVHGWGAAGWGFGAGLGGYREGTGYVPPVQGLRNPPPRRTRVRL